MWAQIEPDGPISDEISFPGQHISDPGPKIRDFLIFLNRRSLHLVTSINIRHIQKRRYQNVNIEEPDLNQSRWICWPVMSQDVGRACFLSWIPKGRNPPRSHSQWFSDSYRGFWKLFCCFPGKVASGISSSPRLLGLFKAINVIFKCHLMETKDYDFCSY